MERSVCALVDVEIVGETGVCEVRRALVEGRRVACLAQRERREACRCGGGLV